MKLKQKIQKIEDVPEEHRKFYTKLDDGTFQLGDVEIEIEDVSGLKSALRKERETVTELQKTLKTIPEGTDLAALLEIQKRLEGDEVLQLVKAGKLEDAKAKIGEQVRKDADKQIAKLQKDLEASQARAKKFDQLVLDNHIRAAVSAAGIHSSAVDDALLRGRTLFSLDEDGNAIARDGDGIKLGKDGKTPYAPKEWIEGMREAAPHWFPASGSGSGAQGSGTHRSANGKQTIKRSVFDSLSVDEKSATVKSGTAIVD